MEVKYDALSSAVNERDKDSVTEIFQEADLRQQLVDAQKKLLKYDALFEADQSAPIDPESVVQQLKRKQEVVDAYQLKESVWEQVRDYYSLLGFLVTEYRRLSLVCTLS